MRFCLAPERSSASHLLRTPSQRRELFATPQRKLRNLETETRVSTSWLMSHKGISLYYIISADTVVEQIGAHPATDGGDTKFAVNKKSTKATAPNGAGLRLLDNCSLDCCLSLPQVALIPYNLCGIRVMPSVIHVHLFHYCSLPYSMA